MKRYFNTTGFCRSDWHYMVNPLRSLQTNIYNLIDNNQYFILHAPRQSGKTTLLHLLAHQLNSEGKYTAVVFSVETAGYRSITEETANRNMINALITTSELFLTENEAIPKYNSEIHFTLKDYLTNWAKSSKKPIVLLLDEVDSLYDDIFVSLLRQLRDGFQVRPKLFPACIALVGLRDVRDYKMKVRLEDKSLGTGSPFNVKSESFTLQNFSLKDVTDLFAQHTHDTGQKFNTEVTELIYKYTNGQPWLVNALANHIVTRMLEGDYTKEITKEIVVQAKEELIQRRDTHLDSLVDKLSETRVRTIVMAIINGEELLHDTFNDELQYCIDLGIVRKDKQVGICFSNPIYQEIIPRVLNYNMQMSMIPKVEPQWFFTKDNRLNMNALLKEFQQFYRENSESWLERFNYKEAGHQLLLMAFLQRVINGGGQIEREMALGNGRCDMMVKYNNQNFVLELKIKRNSITKEEGLEQLIRYLDKLNEAHGYLIIFESKSSTEIAWENRIKWYDIEHTWNEITKQITVVEM